MKHLIICVLLVMGCAEGNLHLRKHVDHKQMYTYRGETIDDPYFCGGHIKVDLSYPLKGIYTDTNGCKYVGNSTPYDHHRTIVQ